MLASLSTELYGQILFSVDFIVMSLPSAHLDLKKKCDMIYLYI
jgi:hypothetical protein